MVMILLIQLSDWFYSLKHSEIIQKKIKQCYYNKTMINFFKGCDVHMFFVEEIIEAVSSIASVTTAITRLLAVYFVLHYVL